MKSFVVMQGETYQAERDLGIIWSPQQDSGGQVPHSWLRMKEVNEGDRFFHYVKGNIVAISVAKTGCQEITKSSYLKSHKHLTDSGYLVELEYHELEEPLNILSNYHEILALLPIKYSPFQHDGNGNPGYLYPCNEQLVIKLLELISDLNIYQVDEEQLELAIGTVRRSERNTFVPLIAEMESEAKLMIRKGQEKFKKELLPLWENKCALCDIELPILLQASHSKPWKDSTHNERVDPYNGLLLCRNHDALYYKGYIAFDGQGRLHISSSIPEDDYLIYNIYPKKKVARHEEHKPYFKWHLKNIFH
ncbi:HNH endonuclease [Psychrobacillus antarcticus]|uniref:HNH endonuclease n=1 Tax=Psychrobacillus antarcticus TaxID=2879115 RepID=UPI00240810AF|nr:HNH endonuclease signature motif containing protein [Psychrobacillus antarcticus]